METTAEFHHYRSEAFAEDVLDLVAQAPDVEAPAGPPAWLVNGLPVAVA